MKRHIDTLIAAVGAYSGALTWIAVFSEGRDNDDVDQAATIAIAAAGLQLLVRRVSKKEQP